MMKLFMMIIKFIYKNIILFLFIMKIIENNDLSSLKEKVTNHKDLDVLNGIAYNKTTNSLFVTGKMWDKLFEIKIIPKT